MNHKTTKIVIKEANVDVNIIKVVSWLNSFKNTITLYSCEGEESQLDPKDYTTEQDLVDLTTRTFFNVGQPYVLFNCEKPHEILPEILGELLLPGTGYAGKVEIGYSNHKIQYTLRFYSKDSLKEFTEHLTAKLKAQMLLDIAAEKI
jgi:hypothetical protein